jgi:hypothetical protein
MHHGLEIGDLLVDDAAFLWTFLSKEKQAMGENLGHH